MKEEYRGFFLIVREIDGKPKGRAIKDNKERLPKFDVEDINFDKVLSELKNLVDTYITDKSNDWDSIEDKVKLCIEGFQKILPKLSDGHLMMLKAHFNSPNKEITATQLAEAAGYKNYNAANMQYGNVGKYLHEEIFVPLMRNKNGDVIYTSAIASEGNTNTNSEAHWTWIMKPEVVAAIEYLGLDK